METSTVPVFLLRSVSAKITSMPDPNDNTLRRGTLRPDIRTRDDLLLLIADAVRLQLTYLPREQALAIADTVLRSFKAADLSVRRRRGA